LLINVCPWRNLCKDMSGKMFTHAPGKVGLVYIRMLLHRAALIHGSL